MRCVLILAALPLPVLAQVEQGSPNAPYQPAFENQTRAPALPSTAVTAQPFAGPLENPWRIANLPDGTFLVTERPGRMRLVAADAREQGGLLDVAVSPDFVQDRVVFWTYAKPMGNGLTATAAGRGILSQDGTQMTEVRDIFVQNPASRYSLHFGSRIVPDGQGLVYVTTGEHFEDNARVLAQDPNATYGKVVRLTENGEALSDNPFAGGGGDPRVWTMGHRNVQGAGFDPQGRFWTIEHGSLGGDELNLSQGGTNYGWPVVSYGLNYDGSPVGSGQPRAEGVTEPVYYWDPVIAPEGDVRRA